MAMQLHTYLNYGGNCEEAFKFYEQHLGGTITMMMRHGEQPNGQDVPNLSLSIAKRDAKNVSCIGMKI